jgi:hypothetical protein
VRILDENTDRSVNAVIIYLTKSEASEMRDSLEQILANPIDRHEHISSSDYTKEVTICIYDPDHLDEQFHERSKRLILEDR